MGIRLKKITVAVYGSLSELPNTDAFERSALGGS